VGGGSGRKQFRDSVDEVSLGVWEAELRYVKEVIGARGAGGEVKGKGWEYLGGSNMAVSRIANERKMSDISAGGQ
jgi:hypothetical protein